MPRGRHQLRRGSEAVLCDLPENSLCIRLHARTWNGLLTLKEHDELRVKQWRSLCCTEVEFRQAGRQARAELGVALDRLDGIPETTAKESDYRSLMDASILASILAIQLNVQPSSSSQPGPRDLTISPILTALNSVRPYRDAESSLAQCSSARTMITDEPGQMHTAWYCSSQIPATRCLTESSKLGSGRSQSLFSAHSSFTSFVWPCSSTYACRGPRHPKILRSKHLNSIEACKITQSNQTTKSSASSVSAIYATLEIIAIVKACLMIAEDSFLPPFCHGMAQANGSSGM